VNTVTACPGTTPGCISNPDLASSQPQDGQAVTETGNLEKLSHSSCYDYVACDVTAGYTSPGYETNGNSAKVSEVSRQLVFFPPDLVVVFDRVEATDPSYQKRFLLHTLQNPELAGSGFTIVNDSGRLVGQTLLPADADVAVIQNWSVAGVSHPPSSTNNCDEAGGTRLEISPKTESAHYFLHVMKTIDSGSTKIRRAPRDREHGESDRRLGRHRAQLTERCSADPR
jgi:heparin/heparan-sulfate lyase